MAGVAIGAIWTLPVPEIVGYVGDGVRKLMNRVLSRHGRENIDEAVGWFKQDYFAHCVEDTRPYDGIEEMLTRLRHAPMAVVTNKPVAMAQRILDELGLAHFFSAVVGGDEGPLKPLPDPLRLALARLGASGEDAAEASGGGGCMVGDFENDILAAQACGMSACGVTWGLDAGRSLAALKMDYLAASPEKLANWLTRSD